MRIQRSVCRRRRSPLFLATVLTALTAATSLACGGTAPAVADEPRTTLVGSRPAYASTGRDLGEVPAQQAQHARLYLGERDPAALTAFLRRVTDPASPGYGHYLTPAQFRGRFALTLSQHRSVLGWLRAAGLTVTADTTHYVDATGTTAAFERAFAVHLHRYRTAWGPLQAPTGAVSVPATVGTDVLQVDGLAAATGSGATRPVMTGAAPAGGVTVHAVAASTCSVWFGQRGATGLPTAYGRPRPFTTCPYSPAQLRRAYGAAVPGATGRGRTVAIVGAYGSPTMPGDADSFARATGDRPFRPGQFRQVVDAKHWQISAACAPPTAWAGEQALDVESVHGYAPDASVLYVGADSCLDQDLMAAEASVIDTRSADIISNSWAEIVHASPGHLTPGLVDAWNMLFEQAAAEGVGVYVASGDCGDSSPGAAQTGLNCDPQTTGAQADFPSGSPWVTSVGATTLATRRDGAYAWETSMGDVLSIQPHGSGDWAPVPGVFTFGGGGGATDFAQPWFQRGRVPAALASVGGHARRVTPDVALEGDGALPVLVGYRIDGRFTLVGYGGTSAACPGFAAIQADAEQASGRAIGFADPLLYALPHAGLFHDVTDSPRAAGPGPLAVVSDQGAAAGELRYVLYTLGQDYGLRADLGFDEATGLGSPDTGYLRWFQGHRVGLGSTGAGLTDAVTAGLGTGGGHG